MAAPPFAKFKEAFEALIEATDISPMRAEELRRASNEDKWAFLRLYKGQMIAMLSNSEEKLARDKRFEEWVRRDKKVQKMVNQPPAHFISSLRDLNISMADMNSLKALLESAPLFWVYHFIDAGGITYLSQLLEYIIFKRYEE